MHSERHDQDAEAYERVRAVASLAKRLEHHHPYDQPAGQEVQRWEPGVAEGAVWAVELGALAA